MIRSWVENSSKSVEVPLDVHLTGQFADTFWLVEKTDPNVDMGYSKPELGSFKDMKLWWNLGVTWP